MKRVCFTLHVRGQVLGKMLGTQGFPFVKYSLTTLKVKKKKSIPFDHEME
jgi:hypothetical protein